jgi:hypothetical protein
MNACSAGACTPDLTTFADVTGCGTLELLSTSTTLYALGSMTGLTSYALPAGGTAVPIGAAFMGGTAFTVDATNAYVAAGKDLKRVKLADGTTDTLVSEADTIWDVAVDSGNVYYATGVNVKMVSATAAAGSAGTVAATAIDDGMAQGVTVSAGYALYASSVAPRRWPTSPPTTAASKNLRSAPPTPPGSPAHYRR